MGYNVELKFLVRSVVVNLLMIDYSGAEEMTFLAFSLAPHRAESTV